MEWMEGWVCGLGSKDEVRGGGWVVVVTFVGGEWGGWGVERGEGR